MRPLPMTVVVSLAILAGCSDQRAEVPSAPAPAPAVAVQPPVDLLGTWTDRSGAGFIAIGARQIVIAVDGTSRSVSQLSENAIEPGMSAGRLGLADRTELYLARGATIIDGVPVDHLDVDVVRPGQPAVRRRLLSETGLRLAARLAQPAAPRTAPVVSGPDGVFVARVPDSRRAAAEQLVAKAAAGSPAAELAAGFAERQRSSFIAILALLEQARALPPERAAERLQEADRSRAEAERFAVAWQAWMAGRG